MPLWLPTDSHRLRQLRLAQQLDTFTLAHRSALSERQLLELEGEGEGGFYSEAIKYQTGLKLLRLLGDETSEAPSTHTPTRARSPHAAAVALPLHVAPPAENHKLLHSIGLALALFGVLISFVNVMDGLGLRPGGMLLSLIGLAILVLVRLGRNTWAVLVLCWGFLAMTFSSAFVIRGLGNVSWVAPPIAIMAAGWFLGRAMAWMMAAVSSLGAVLLYALHRQQFPFATEVPLETLLAALLVACAVAAFIGGAISQTYGRQFELISESRAELLAVMDSTRALIWSVSAHDLGLRTFNRLFERAVTELRGQVPKLAQRPEQVFNGAELGARWREAYQKAIDSDGLAWEEDVLGDGRRFEVSCQPIRQSAQVIGLAVFAREITRTVPAP